MFFSRPLHAAVITFSLIIAAAYGAFLLPDDEVEALREIAKTIGKTNWNFSADPCGGEWGWADPNPIKGSENAVTCNCSFSNATVCHVISIMLKSQDLQGTLPVNLSKLPYLQEIDLTRNYLNGTIPPEWGSTQLVNISILVNRLTGPIPKEIGNISTLVNFTVEFNQLSGSLPPELGNLNRLEKMHLTSNNFSGQLPETFTKLAALKDFRVGDNRFTGPIPNFIQNMTNLQKLVIQGSGFSGPITPGIASLVNMTDLRISDLGNGTQAFPPLSNMKSLKTLILRSCNIIGQLPSYLGEMGSLKTLDLSFNKLNGTIPRSYSGLDRIEKYLYLTGNQLSGTVPEWILRDGENVDLSYNNFTVDGPCQQHTINLFRNTGNVSKMVSCLTDPCQKNYYSFHVNCGGGEVTSNGVTYEADTDLAGPVKFVKSGTNWAFSSTGHFIDDGRPSDSYIWTNSTPNISLLYKTARISPITLTYYGFCLANGSYTVSLQFAEIMFAPGNTYFSLGRRYFDIYIQGKLVKKDFNIEDEAGGIWKPVVINFTTIVTSGTLEIRFYWAGKGTTGIPNRGVYGPLVSAISITSDFLPPSEGGSGSGSGISASAVVGIVVSVAAIIFLVLGVLWWIGCLKRKQALKF